MEIGKIIKKYRRERDMTQEQLAEFLCVSVSAVSQWESGKTTPDLSMIPVICNLFDITSDELLGIDVTQKEDRIKEISKEASKYKRNGYLAEAQQILEDGLRAFPNSYRLMCDLMYTNYSRYCFNEETACYRDEAIRLAEIIMEADTHKDGDYIRDAAKQVLCYGYHFKGEHEKALEIADSLSSIWLCKDLMRPVITRGEVQQEAHHWAICVLLDHLGTELHRNIEIADGQLMYTNGEMAVIYQKAISLYELVIDDGNFGFYNERLENLHLLLVKFYAEKQNEEQTIYHLAKAADHAIAFVQCGGASDMTCLVLRGYKNSNTSTNVSANNAKVMLEKLENPVFDFVRNREEFKAITARLEAVAGDWAVQ